MKQPDESSRIALDKMIIRSSLKAFDCGIFNDVMVMGPCYHTFPPGKASKKRER